MGPDFFCDAGPGVMKIIAPSFLFHEQLTSRLVPSGPYENTEALERSMRYESYLNALHFLFFLVLWYLIGCVGFALWQKKREVTP